MSLSSSGSLAMVLSLLLLLSRPGSVAADGQPPSKAIVTPIVKDTSTSLYFFPAILADHYPLLIVDLAGSLVWSTTCQQGHRTIPCKSSVCKVANRNRPAGCASAANGGEPGNADPHCACTTYPYNPVNNSHCGNGDLTVFPMSATATDGEHPFQEVSFNAFGSCAPGGLLESLPPMFQGVAGMSRLPVSLPSQVASKLKLANQFALCLSNDRYNGVALFGGAPLVIQSAAGPVGVQASLPLLKNRKNAGAYYFRVHGIAVNQELVPIAPGALDLNTHTGKGGVVFSTVTRYTTLRSDIFGAFLTAFDKATSGIQLVKPPPPHFRCFAASSFPSTRLGPGVANIDFLLDNGQNWTLPGASSLVQVNEGTLCFAFQNMGSDQAPDAPAIIFGTHQMVDNLVQFNLEKSTFGFSGLLLGRGTHCGNFGSID